jgi:hypothetical protein
MPLVAGVASDGKVVLAASAVSSNCTGDPYNEVGVAA